MKKLFEDSKYWWGDDLKPRRGNGLYYWTNSNDQLHRDHDLPAVIYDDGIKKWYQNGKLDRLNGKYTILEADGTKVWMWNLPNNTQYWHREDGPTIQKKWCWQHKFLWKSFYNTADERIIGNMGKSIISKLVDKKTAYYIWKKESKNVTLPLKRKIIRRYYIIIMESFYLCQDIHKVFNGTTRYMAAIAAGGTIWLLLDS